MHAHDEQENQIPRSARQPGTPESSAGVPLLDGSSSAEAVLAAQRLIGNAAVSRLLADGEDEQSARSDAVHRALRDSGRPIEPGVRADLEARLGADFADVRVHTDSTAHAAAESVQAQAFTSGSHIVFRRGQYATSSDPGKRVLAHELTHVLQQRSGPVAGTETADGLRVSDPSDRFEQEADAVATEAMRTPYVHNGQSGSSGGSGPAVVARLMSSARFREASSSLGLRARSDVTEIDDALAVYHQTTRNQYQRRADALRTIVDLCGAYLARSRNEQRKSGVRLLLSQASVEIGVYQAMAENETLQNPVEKFRLMAEALDSILRSELTEPDTANDLGFLDIPGKLQLIAGPLFSASPDEFRELAEDNVDILRGLVAKPDLPAETKRILEEVLSYRDQISLEGGGPQGTSLLNRDPNAPGPRYRFRAALGHAGGSAERAGYFAHEMTHVAAHESFDNTPVMLLFPPSIEDDDLRELMDGRAATIDQLRAALDQGRAAFTPSQLGLIESKLTYGMDPGRVQRYVSSFRAANKITDDEVVRINHWITVTGDRTGLMVEYDTVLNQMLVYLQMWEIDRGNPFYVRLRQAGQDAYDYRRAALAARQAQSASTSAASSP